MKQPLLWVAVLAVGLAMHSVASAQVGPGGGNVATVYNTGGQYAGSPGQYYHYPYWYFPHNYWPTTGQKWPEKPGDAYMYPPAYMAYPPFHEPHWRYNLWAPRSYYRGFHFWLDQF